jgi:hypothetical protein
MEEIMRKWILLAVGFLFVSLIIPFAAPQVIHGQDHVVTSSDLRNDLAAASAARQKSQSQLEEFVSSSEAQKALKTAHIDSGEVKNAIPQLSDEDLAQLSARSEKAQKDFAAGRMSDRDLLIILIGVAALILIIVAVR